MVKPIKFGKEGERDVGSPLTTAQVYNSQDADELIFLDITASSDGRKFLKNTLKQVSENCFVPLTVGGGIRSIQDIQELLKIGADKITINSFALESPPFIKEASDKYGSQCIVVSIDIKKNEDGKYEVFKNRGKIPTGLDPIMWAKKAVSYGAGEILITSIDREGTLQGYDLNLIKMITEAVSVPVIANGGAGNRQDFVDAVKKSNASAVAASSVFHFSDSSLTQVKSFIYNSGIPIRPI